MHIVKLMIPCVFSWVFKYQGWAPMYLLRDGIRCRLLLGYGGLSHFLFLLNQMLPLTLRRCPVLDTLYTFIISCFTGNVQNVL